MEHATLRQPELGEGLLAAHVERVASRLERNELLGWWDVQLRADDLLQHGERSVPAGRRDALYAVATVQPQGEWLWHRLLPATQPEPMRQHSRSARWAAVRSSAGERGAGGQAEAGEAGKQ